MKVIIDYGIIGLLMLLGFVIIFFGIERILYYRSIDISKYSSRISLELDLSRNLSTVATIGSNAPYIGLLGTVIAIILTFYVMGDAGNNIDTGEIMKNLALALKATAAGLAVAIPATVIYNILSEQVDVLLAKWDIHQENIASQNK
ncbi:MAG: TonB-system energizer ExbB [Campylobacterales bacterium]|nr:TonB-system energizer ExbB [Campylobacterales bacterium]